MKIPLLSRAAASRTSLCLFILFAVIPFVALGIATDHHLLAESPDLTLAIVPALCAVAIAGLAGFRRSARQYLTEHDAAASGDRDPLTELPDRRLFEERLGRELAQPQRGSRQTAVCCLGLDGFRRFNESLGHAAGDDILRQVVARLTASLRQAAPIARPSESPDAGFLSRLGGDEFTFLFADLSDPQRAANAVWRVLEALRKPFFVEDHEVSITASVGIAVAPSDGSDARSLLRNSESAMVWAKQRGRNNYQFYSPAMTITSARRLEIEARLRVAVETAAFVLHYQPLVTPSNSRISAAEALLRWNDPQRGLVHPPEFLSVAEDTALIVPIGAWVLHTACLEAAQLRAEGFRLTRMAVNVSAKQLRRPTFVPHVRSALVGSGLPANALELEVTESAILEDDEVTNRAIGELDALGISLALDDFGTGYSSLTHLRRLPIRRVKIDRSFVMGIETEGSDRSLVLSLIELAHGMGLEVVAEGVETVEQARLLAEAGCDELQGYSVSSPIPADDLRRLLRATESA